MHGIHAHASPFKMKVKISLSKRLTYRIMAVVLVLMVIMAGVVQLTVRKYMLNEAKERYQNVLIEYLEGLRRRLSDVYVAAENNVHDIESDLDNPDKLFAHVERIVKKNKNIICCGLLFEPDYYPHLGKFFVPYATRGSDDQIRVTRIDSIYQGYIDEGWYQERMKKDSADWTEAYFENLEHTNNNGQRLLTTYAIPIHDGKAQHPVALLCCDLSLEWMRTRMMENAKEINRKYEKGHKHQSYSLVVNSQGTYIIHPDKKRMLSDTLEVKNVIKENNGSVMVTIDGVKSWIYYHHIKYTDWTMVIVVPEDVILYNSRVLNLIILLVMIVGLVAIYLFCRHQIKEIADPIALQEAAVERELQIAHDIQMAMLPKTFPPFSERNDIELYGKLNPAKAVGGDLYDFFISDEKLFFCIGDVSGKGVPASLVMAVTQTLFRNVATHIADYLANPKHIVDSVNASVSEGNDNNMFVTLFVGVLDLKMGHLRYCNAGHDAPYIDGTLLHCDSNLPVGVMPDWEFTEQETDMAPGSMIFLYTDGLTEAENAQHEQFGEQRVTDVITAFKGTPQELIKSMTDAVHQFVGDTEQSDDLTMLAIKYTSGTGYEV